MAHPLPRDIEDCYVDLYLAEKDMNFPTNDIWLFTWNPRDTGAILTNHDQKWRYMLEAFHKFLRCMKQFAVVPELSDAGRLHAHGWFIIGDKVKWHKAVLPYFKALGMFKMNKMNSLQALYYYQKDLNETFNILTDDYFPFTHVNAKDIRKRILQIRKARDTYYNSKPKKDMLDYFGVAGCNKKYYKDIEPDYDLDEYF